MKTCSSCRRDKPLSDFSKKTASKDGLMSACRECNRARSSTWAAQNRSRRNASQARYRKRTYVPSEGFVALAARPHALYRAYDAHGVLLYVGISADPKQRLSRHRREKPWWVDVDRVVVEILPDRDAAQAAETLAVQTENPLHNLRKCGSVG